MQNRDAGRPIRGKGGSASAFVLAIAGRTRGVLVREGKGFRFNASDPMLRRLDGAFFGSVAEAEAAAELISMHGLGAGESEVSFSALF